MTRYLLGLIAATGLSLGMTSGAQAQIAVSVGNPYNGAGVVVAPPGLYNSYYGRPVGPGYYGPRAYGYAPRPYIVPRFYGGYGYGPRVYNRGYGGGRGRRW